MYKWFGVADRQEGPAVSVGLLGDLWSVLFIECYSVYQNKKYEIIRACGKYGGQERSIEGFGEGT
jgi:hypothetical protein